MTIKEEKNISKAIKYNIECWKANSFELIYDHFYSKGTTDPLMFTVSIVNQTRNHMEIDIKNLEKKTKKIHWHLDQINSIKPKIQCTLT